jgi:hypothetical protein
MFLFCVNLKMSPVERSLRLENHDGCTMSCVLNTSKPSRDLVRCVVSISSRCFLFLMQDFDLEAAIVCIYQHKIRLA